MSLLSDIVNSIVKNKSAIFVKLKSIGVPVSDNVISVTSATFKTAKVDENFKAWAVDFIASKIRNKSTADGSDPLKTSIGLILTGDQDAELISKQAKISESKQMVIPVLITILVGFATWYYWNK